MAGLNTIKEIKAPMWDQMQVFCKQISDHQIRLVMHFDEILDEKILIDAVKITVENNPIVCANYVENTKTSLWKFSEIDIEQIYSCQECREPETFIQEAILEEINTYTGPLVKISLIRSETDVLVLNCDHAITDAAGVKGFTYELAQNYSRISQNIKIQRQTYIPSRSLKIVSNKLRLKEKASILKVMFSGKKEASTFTKEADLNNLQNPGFISFTIKPDKLEEIKEFGKRYSATVNDMLLTVYYYTLQKIVKNSNKTNRLTFSSDIRTYLEGENHDVLSNFSAIHNIDIDNSINNFVELLKEISAITKTRKQKKYDLADFPMMAVLFKTMPYKKLKALFFNQFDKIKKGKTHAAPGITNMGIIEEEKIQFDSVFPSQAYLLGTISHPGLLILGISTYKRHMTISTGSYLNENNKAFISKLVEEFKVTMEMEIFRNEAHDVLKKAI